MKKNFCDYHPTRHAFFTCDKCFKNFCSQCVCGVRNQLLVKSYYYMCPKCNVELTELRLSDTMKPFWKQLSSFFKYPLQRTPLILIGLLTLGFLICLLPGTAGYALMLVPLIVYFAVMPLILLGYCNGVFNKTTKGDFSVAPQWHELDSDMPQILKQFALLLFLFFPGMAAFGFDTGNGLLNIVFFLVVFIQPAIMITMVASKRILKAVNPIVLFKLISLIGWPYCMLVVFIFLLFNAPIVLAFSFPGSWYISFLLLIAAWQYYMIVIYNLLGYVTLQYQEKLGFHVKRSSLIPQPHFDKLSSQPMSYQIQHRLLSEVDILIKEGKLSDALDLIRVNTKGEFHNTDLGLRCVSLLEQSGKSEIIPIIGKDLLDLLAEENHCIEGMDLYKKCLNEDSSFLLREETLHWLLDSFERSDDTPWAKHISMQLSNDYLR